MTAFLLDTNVISEMRKKQPHPGVVKFVTGVQTGTLYLGCLTFGELRLGVELKRRKDTIAAHALARWVDGLELDYRDRTLGVTTEIATLWGTWTAQRSRPTIDTLLAATAAVHQLVLVTRNEHDVRDLPIEVLNPWQLL